MSNIDPEKLVGRAVRVVKSGTFGSFSSSEDDSEESRTWWTTYFQYGPLSGIFCILMALASLAASLGILVLSDGQDVSHWSSPTSTYLAIFTAISNLAMRCATIQGVIITWWLRASKGSSLAKLHWDWHSGTTLRGALTSGRHLGFLGLACIFSTIIILDGPLIQRASTVVSTPYVNYTVPLNVSIAMEIPTGFTGSWGPARKEGMAGVRWSQLFNDTIPTNNGSASNYIWTSPYGLAGNVELQTKDWWDERPLTGVVKGCSGVCSVKLLAPAFYPTVCTTHTVPLNIRGHVDVAEINTAAIAPPLDHDVFMIDVSLVLGEQETINLITGAATLDSDCQGTLTYSICTLVSAIGLYEVKVSGEELSLSDLKPPTLVALANNTAVSHTWVDEDVGYPSTLAGFVNMMYTKWSSLVYYHTVQSRDLVLGTVFGDAIPTESLHKKPANCPAYSDPFDRVIQSMNQLMIYAGAAAAQANESYLSSHMDPDLPIHRNITGDLLGNHNVFNTDYRFFLGAAIVQMLCVLVILPLYWNFWQLGRPVSFSPLELAKAFESPILEDCKSNSTARELAKAVGASVVKYGVVTTDSAAQKTKLAFGNPLRVDYPQRGRKFDY